MSQVQEALGKVKVYSEFGFWAEPSGIEFVPAAWWPNPKEYEPAAPKRTVQLNLCLSCGGAWGRTEKPAIRHEDGTWEHVDCRDPYRARTGVCTECFMELAADGHCGNCE